MPLHNVEDLLATLQADLAELIIDEDVEGLFSDEDLSVGKHIVETIDDLKVHTISQQKDYQTVIRDYVSKFPLSRGDRRRFLSVIGVNKKSNQLRASNFRARRKFSLLVIEQLLQLLDKSKKHPNFRAWFVTFKDKRFDTTDKLACVNLYSFKDNCQKEIRKVPGLNGFGVMEVQVVTNHPRKGAGRHLFVGSHALLWSFEDDVNLSWLNSTGKFQSAFDNEGIHISEVDELKEADFATIAAYMCKMPMIGKTLNKLEATEYAKEKFFLKSDMNVRPAVLLRIVEILSHFNISDMMFATGEGKLIWNYVDKSLRARQDKIDEIAKGVGYTDVDGVELYELWGSIWDACPYTHFNSPGEIIGNRRDMPTTID